MSIWTITPSEFQEELKKNPSIAKLFKRMEELQKLLKKHEKDREWLRKNGDRVLTELRQLQIILGLEGWVEVGY